jgi:hypothetical protein
MLIHLKANGVRGFMRQSILSLFIIGGVLSIHSLPAPAQTNPGTPPASSAAPTGSPDVYFINRAKNLARQAAITANGGLLRYRPDPAMFGPAVQTQYLRNGDGSITFTFTGSAPGGANPSVETVATVAPGGAVKLDYNGPPRNIGAGSLNLSQPTAVQPTAAQNLPVQIPVLTPGLPPASLPKPPVSSSAAIKPTAAPRGGDSSAPGVRPLSLPKLSESSSTAINPTTVSGKGDSPVSLPKLPASNSTAIKPTAAPALGVGDSAAPGVRPTSGSVEEDAFFAKARNLARQAAIKANGGLSRYRPEPSMFGPSAQTPVIKNANGSLTFKFKGGAPGTAELPTESVVTVNPAGSVNLEYNGPAR